jgi:CheY-like chemotaxis protein
MMEYTSEFKEHVEQLVAQSKQVLNKLEESNNKEQLINIAQNIVSASKMEDHPEINVFASFIENIAKLIHAGSLPTTQAVKDRLTESFNEIVSKLQSTGYDISPVRIDQLKSLLNEAKREDKDYVIIRSLKVLYIDQDNFSHYNVKKHSGPSIMIDSCFSAQDALKKIQAEKFDVILCDLNLNDKALVNLFNSYSKRIPIVAISASDNPRDAQIATRMGAKDFIVKNDGGIRWLPRALHTTASEWQRQIKKQRLLDPNAKRLLKFMLSIASPLRQKVDSRIVVAAEATGEIAKEIDINNTLEKLIVSHYIVRQPLELTIGCPICKSSNIKSRYICRNCGASNFVRGRVIEHNKCGHVDLENSYEGKAENKLTCPKCNKDLKLIGVDYFRLESAFKCLACHIVFSSPTQTYDCNNCTNSNIKFSDMVWNPINRYEISQEKIGEIRRSIVTLDDIEKFLLQKGYKVNLEYKIESKFESFGPFDIVAKKDDRIIIIVTLGSDIEESFSKLVELDVVDKSAMIGKTSKYAIAFSELREVTWNIIKKFNIIPVVVEDEKKVLEKFKEKFLDE